MAHTYATVDEWKAFAQDNGVATFSPSNDGTIRGFLETSSRRVDGYCGRSPTGQSGFGPRSGTNSYDAQGWYGGHTLYRDNMVLELEDDLLSASGVTVLDATGGSAYPMTEGTDFYFQPYNRLPRRRLVITGLGQNYIYPGLKIVSIPGVWGYASQQDPVAATLGTVTAGATTAIITGAGVALGATLRVDSEDLYVTATTAGTALSASGGTVTVARGANGTTAAVHSAGAAIAVHNYPPEVKTATMLLAMRRWRGREAGLSGDYGGGGVPMFGNRDTDLSILAGNVYHLKVFGIG